MLRDTPSSQDASTHQIWNSYLKEYRRYAPDTKRDGRTHGRTDGRTVRLLYASQSSFGGIKINKKRTFSKFDPPLPKHSGSAYVFLLTDIPGSEEVRWVPLIVRARKNHHFFVDFSLPSQKLQDRAEHNQLKKTFYEGSAIIKFFQAPKAKVGSEVLRLLCIA